MLLDALWSLWKEVFQDNDTRDDTRQRDTDSIWHPVIFQLNPKPWLRMSFLLLESPDHHEWVAPGWWYPIARLFEDFRKGQRTREVQTLRRFDIIDDTSRYERHSRHWIISSIQRTGCKPEWWQIRKECDRRGWRANLRIRWDWGQASAIIY